MKNTIENKLKEIGAYFINKVIEGDYKVIRVRRELVAIEIDKKYRFILRAGEDVIYFEFYQSNSKFDIISEYLKIQLPEERLKAYNNLIMKII